MDSNLLISDSIVAIDSFDSAHWPTYILTHSPTLPPTWRRLCTRLWMTVGSGAIPAPGTGASGSAGGPPS